MATWLSRLLPKDDASQSIHLQFVGDEVPLSEVGAGQEARIVSLETLPLTRQRYLHAFGIVPGAIISIQQQRPVTIIEVDRTELAIEREVAEGIRTAIQLVRTK
jgi:Fe2+ transport system protein FeoA